MTNNLIGIQTSADGASGALVTREGEHRFVARLFADNQWHAVSLLNQKTSQQPVAIAWTREEIAPAWFSIKATLTNQGRAPVRLGSFHMLEGRHLGLEVSDPVVFLDSGGEGFAGAVKGTKSCPPYFEKWTSLFMAEEDIDWAKAEMSGNLEAGAHHSLAGLMVYYRAKGLSTWMLSFLVPMERCSASPILLIDPRTGGVRAFALVNNFAGYELPPGESINTETILLGRFGDPHKALETWADTCAQIHRLKVWHRPPVGWLSWYGYHFKQR